MGRYDKIRVWNGSAWKQPSRMYVWNGSSWVDFGANDSDNTRSLYVWNGSWQRKTLNQTWHLQWGAHYLQYSGGAGINFGFEHQMTYNSKYEFIVTPQAQGNYMMFEIARQASSPTTYARFGFYYGDGTYYVYGKSRYNGGTAWEINTKGWGSLAAGVKYTIAYYCASGSNTGTVWVYNHSSGSTWTPTGTIARCSLNTNGGGSGMFGGYSLSDRNLYGQVWYAYAYGKDFNGNVYEDQYWLDNTPEGQAWMVPSIGRNAWHSGWVEDTSYWWYDWT